MAYKPLPITLTGSQVASLAYALDDAIELLDESSASMAKDLRTADETMKRHTVELLDCNHRMKEDHRALLAILHAHIAACCMEDNGNA